MEAWEVHAESPGRIQLQVRRCFPPRKQLLILAGGRNLIRSQSPQISPLFSCANVGSSGVVIHGSEFIVNIPKPISD